MTNNLYCLSYMLALNWELACHDLMTTSGNKQEINIYTREFSMVMLAELYCGNNNV